MIATTMPAIMAAPMGAAIHPPIVQQIEMAMLFLAALTSPDSPELLDMTPMTIPTAVQGRPHQNPQESMRMVEIMAKISAPIPYSILLRGTGWVRGVVSVACG